MTRAIIILMLFCGFFTLHSQENDTLSYAEQLALLEAEMDSLSIFNLIDSLFEFQATPSSELNVRLGFTSSVTSAGRDYDLNQQGYSPGIAFYHRSGAYADLSGYWSTDISPKYNPTILSLGYLGTLNKKASYSVDYEKWFFSPQDTSLNPLTNSLSASINYDFKVGYVSFDYSYLFGDETSNRLIGTLAGNINLGKWWQFNNVSLYPSTTVLYGNGVVTILRITEQSFREATASRIAGITTFENFNDSQKRTVRRVVLAAFNNEIISERERNSLLQKTFTDEALSSQDMSALRAIASGTYFSDEYVDENKFGLLNYAFTLPLVLTSNRLTLLFSYTYSVPVSLPGELFEIDPLGYFGASVAYRIPFK